MFAAFGEQCAPVNASDAEESLRGQSEGGFDGQVKGLDLPQTKTGVAQRVLGSIASQRVLSAVIMINTAAQ